MALVVDTGPLVAALSSRDPDHDRCRLLLEQAREELVVPAPVLVEVDWLLSSRDYRGKFETVLVDILAGAYHVEALRTEDYARVQELCVRYADASLGFVDAAVLAIVERLGEPKVATLDHRHFGIMRPRHVTALRLLPE